MTIVILRPFMRADPGRARGRRRRSTAASRFGFFWRILLPLSGPALITVGVLAFVASWNAYLLPLLVLSDPDQYTLPLGVAAVLHRSTRRTPRAILAFTSLAMVPALVFFVLAERRIVGGLTGAVKG